MLHSSNRTFQRSAWFSGEECNPFRMWSALDATHSLSKCTWALLLVAIADLTALTTALKSAHSDDWQGPFKTEERVHEWPLFHTLVVVFTPHPALLSSGIP